MFRGINFLSVTLEMLQHFLASGTEIKILSTGAVVRNIVTGRIPLETAIIHDQYFIFTERADYLPDEQITERLFFFWWNWYQLSHFASYKQCFFRGKKRNL